jgi:hypothetical protein
MHACMHITKVDDDDDDKSYVRLIKAQQYSSTPLHATRHNAHTHIALKVPGPDWRDPGNVTRQKKNPLSSRTERYIYITASRAHG